MRKGKSVVSNRTASTVLSKNDWVMQDATANRVVAGGSSGKAY